MPTETQPKLDDTPLTQWPPVAHLLRGGGRDPKEGDKALCGARMMGIKLDDAAEVCEECLKIAKGEMPDAG